MKTLKPPTITVKSFTLPVQSYNQIRAAENAAIPDIVAELEKMEARDAETRRILTRRKHGKLIF